MSGAFISPVRWMEKPVTPPYTCAFCHVGHDIRESYLDMGISYDFEGIVYICDECSKTLRRGAGWYDQAEVDSMVVEFKNRIIDLEQQLITHQALVTYLQGINIDPVGILKLVREPEKVSRDLFLEFGGTENAGLQPSSDSFESDFGDTVTGNSKSDPDDQGTDGDEQKSSGETVGVQSTSAATTDSLFPEFDVSRRVLGLFD